MIIEVSPSARDWNREHAAYVLTLVLRSELARGGPSDATLCLLGDEWVIETTGSPPRNLLKVRVLAPPREEDVLLDF